MEGLATMVDNIYYGELNLVEIINQKTLEKTEGTIKKWQHLGA